MLRAQQALRLPLLPLVTVAVLLVFGTLGFAVVWWWSLPRLGHHAGTTARMNAAAVGSAVELFHAQAPGAHCPSIEDLEHADILNSSTRTVDPWGRGFRIRCFGQRDVAVISAGPDRMFGTTDDIVERSRRRARVTRAASPEPVSITLARHTDADVETQSQLAALRTTSSDTTSNGSRSTRCPAW